jgi:phosphatidylserine decarboxylase
MGKPFIGKHSFIFMKKKWVLFPFTIVLIILGFLAQFYRDPPRTIPSMGVLSPADGKIISIQKIKPGDIPVVQKGEEIYLEELQEFIAEECYLIAIFMGPFDVHVNRSPIQGTVTSIVYVEGSHFMASQLVLQNERNIIIIEGGETMAVIQIAGKMARRIQCFVKEGDPITRGDKLGRIILGSQVVLVLPSSYRVTVEMGDRVKAGETIIALS